MLLSSLAVAAPLDRRARRTKTETVVTTVFSTVTVYDDEPAPTSSQGLFYEQPASSAVAASSTAVYVAPAPSSPAAAPQSSAPAAVPAAVPATSAPVVQPAATSAAPAPVVPAVSSAAPVVTPTPTPAPAAPVTPATSAAPAAPVSTSPASSPSTPSTGGYSGDLTMYNGYGGYGACGTVLNDSDVFVALSKGVFGDSTYNAATGDATNPWCGATITVTANGKTVSAKVVDRCAGCAGEYDVDGSPAFYSALGLDASAPGRSKCTWSKSS